MLTIFQRDLNRAAANKVLTAMELRTEEAWTRGKYGFYASEALFEVRVGATFSLHAYINVFLWHCQQAAHVSFAQHTCKRESVCE